MRRRKIVIFTLIFCLTLPLAACASGGAGPEQLAENAPQEEVPEEPPLTLEDIRTVSFADVEGSEAWADCVRYVAHQQLMNGTGAGAFTPEGLVTRAAAAAVLFRMSGEEAPEYAGPFTDVQAGDWYAGALAWALEAGLFDGLFPADQFGPGEAVTREQLAALLVRHNQYMSAKVEDSEEEAGDEDQKDAGDIQAQPLAASGQEGATAAQLTEVQPSLAGYRDADAVSEALAADVAQALEDGFFRGMVSDTIYPKLPVNRWQMAEALTALSALETEEPLAAQLAGSLQAKKVESIVAANHEAVQAKVDEIAKKYGAAGLQVAVLEDGEVTDTFAYGWATRDVAPMTADHKMRVASLSKVSVGMAAMVLRDRGVVDIDASIGDYWGFPTKNTHYPDTPVSIRALLSHTSSIPMYGDETSRARSAVEANLRNNRYNNMKPGSVYSWGYNNYGFSVLGLTLEIAAGDYMDNILGNSLWSVMDIDAAFETGEIKNTDLLATIYRHDGSVGRSREGQLNYKRGASYASTGTSFAGGLTISARDQAKLLGLLINDGTYQGLRLLSRESVELMETRFDQQLSDGTYQALPLRSQDNIYGRDRLYYHTGSAYGVYNCMSYDPAAGDGVVVLTTGASAAKDANGIYAVCGNIAQYIYELTAEQPAETAVTPAPAEETAPAAEAVQPAETPEETAPANG